MEVKIDLDRIEREAREATQGKWAVGLNKRNSARWVTGGYVDVCDLYHKVEHNIFIKQNAEANARHIANMDPETTLALIAEVKRLREALKPFSEYAGALFDGNNLECRTESLPDDFPVIGRATGNKEAVLTHGDFRVARKTLGETNA